MIQLNDYKKEHKKAVKSLEDYVQTNYSEEEQEQLAWHTDKISNEHYIWIFDYNGETIELKAHLLTGAVQENKISKKPKTNTPWKN